MYASCASHVRVSEMCLQAIIVGSYASGLRTTLRQAHRSTLVCSHASSRTLLPSGDVMCSWGKNPHKVTNLCMSGGDRVLKRRSGVQVGDKRWFKGAKKDAYGAFDSFIVA